VSLEGWGVEFGVVVQICRLSDHVLQSQLNLSVLVRRRVIELRLTKQWRSCIKPNLLRTKLAYLLWQCFGYQSLDRTHCAIYSPVSGSRKSSPPSNWCTSSGATKTLIAATFCQHISCGHVVMAGSTHAQEGYARPHQSQETDLPHMTGC
jgi:hypothetical protein